MQHLSRNILSEHKPIILNERRARLTDYRVSKTISRVSDSYKRNIYMYNIDLFIVKTTDFWATYGQRQSCCFMASKAAPKPCFSFKSRHRVNASNKYTLVSPLLAGNFFFLLSVNFNQYWYRNLKVFCLKRA